MSRSRKKAIYKDKGYSKQCYWRVHRRVNKQVISSAITSHYDYKYVYCPKCDNYTWWEFEYTLDELDEMAYNDPDKFELYQLETRECYDVYMKNFKLPDNGWEIEDNLKHSKELINDYDYSDYRLDYEYDKMRGYYFWHGEGKAFHEEWYRERLEYKKKMSRK